MSTVFEYNFYCASDTDKFLEFIVSNPFRNFALELFLTLIFRGIGS